MPNGIWPPVWIKWILLSRFCIFFKRQTGFPKFFPCFLGFEFFWVVVPEIIEKMLIRSLQDLEFHQIVVRKAFDVVPPKVGYSLTDYGRSAIPLLLALFNWGENHIEKHKDLVFH